MDESVEEDLTAEDALASSVAARSADDADATVATAAAAFCGTRLDETATDLGGEVGMAPPGSECKFGVDPRDEGRHCIMDLEYGALGWCFTREDKSQWGSCNDGCPLAGVDGVLEAKVDLVTKRLKEVSERFGSLKCCGKKENDTSKGEEEKAGGEGKKDKKAGKKEGKKAGKKAPASDKKTPPVNGKKKKKKSSLLGRLMKTAPSHLPMWAHARHA